MNSQRIKMSHKLLPLSFTSKYDFEIMDIGDVTELAMVMLESIKHTCEDRGETLADLIEELDSVLGGSFAPYIADASYQIKQNGETVSAIMISYFEGYPLISEIFTKKKYQNLGMASSLINKSINSLISMGYESLILNVNRDNMPAINLYRKIGFEVENLKD